MRLLSRVDGGLSFTEFRDPPSSYATLSHTWVEGEVTYQDVLANNLDKVGAKKLDFLLEQAASYNIEYVWIDTCCIDKTDRVEVGEAINRMWQWYAQCSRCFVYLIDVGDPSQVRESKWFTRGWTLQELLAPKSLLFFDAKGRFLGDRVKLRHDIHVACEVDVEVPLNDVPLPERFRWSLSRKTTVEEDASYCLVGLLEVKILFNYGEDAEGARRRLLEEVADEHGKRVVREMQQILTDYAAQQKMTKKKPKVMTESSLLQELEFEAEYRRWEAISPPYQGTCVWVLAHQDYKQWTSGRTRLLWIKGKAGSGKSTIMKFIQLKTGGVHVGFYFNARGDSIEHSTLGLYRSILAQLLRRTKKEIAKQVLSHIICQSKSGIKWAVTTPMLQATLRYAVGLLQQNVRCYIDALDECSKREVQEMLNFFGAISSERLSICFASRHYPAVAIPKSVEIVLEKQDHSDIATLVDGRLAVQEDPLELKRQIIEKANGVFLWAVLVINLLNEDLSNGNLYQVEQRLIDLPAELEDLLREVILRNPEDEMHRFRLCLCWLLYSFRALKAKEFYSSMVAGLRRVNMAPHQLYSDSISLISARELERFVSSCSRGLAEVTPDSTVQVVHESVREFLLHHRGMQMLIPDLDVDMSSWAHNQLKEVCFYYACPSGMITMGKWKLGKYVKEYTVLHAEMAAAFISQDIFLMEMDKLDAASMLRFYTPKWPEKRPGLMGCLIDFNVSHLVRDASRLSISTRPCDDLFSLLALALSRKAMDSYEALLEYGLELESGHDETALSLSMYKHKLPQLRTKLSQLSASQHSRRTTPITLLHSFAGHDNMMHNLLEAMDADDMEVVDPLPNSEVDFKEKNGESKTALHSPNKKQESGGSKIALHSPIGKFEKLKRRLLNAHR